MKPLNRGASRPTKPRELVLYVEDEAENRDVARLRLERDYELCFAATDEEACQILKDRGADIAAVLMDIQLKGSALDGIQLTVIEGDGSRTVITVPTLMTSGGIN